MQAEIDDLKTDKTRLEKKVERLMKENEDLKYVVFISQY